MTYNPDVPIDTGNVVRIDDLIQNIGLPGCPSMPGRDESIVLSDAPVGRRLSSAEVSALSQSIK